MNAAQPGAPGGWRVSPYVVLLIAAWTVAMTARLYPQFDTALRIDGRITTVDDYVADRCSTRLGPDAASCLVAARRKAQTQLRREQARTALIIVAPAVLYSLYLPLAAVADARRRRAARRNQDGR
ncbi:MAG: hypothetical protein KGL22_00075 [Alphaproteobacteria bacterium]|nr:hypothetical protein [Alphaproteobacteria bacterium]MDE2512471.1 hypothetical protein [Alphaproteobacteria bacterium]